ncbi:hypothetical protein CVT26_007403 [Gymnopilus dilepis]|uniref:Condensation domain-containing protein n=1 Tax=Gymnopilus dilepis TaxID=231916 RepID=A0A409WQC6_9AGAR|nr:hypothetical protein CVT26_007403 [Gymnopilus dilepis]
MPDSEPKGEMQFAYYPLSDFDLMLRGTGITLGWLVEGIIDKAQLEVVLQNLVSKWPLLGGRLESVMGEQGMQFRVKVPLPGSEAEGEDGYAPFVLTSRDSEEPITRFIDVPLPSISDSLPLSLFKDTSAPSDPRAWESEQQQGDVPLTHWHLTFFRPNSESKHDRPFTCIGLTFSHVVFDGMGIASVVHALEAESLGRPWSVSPAPLVPGHNANALETTLDRIENAKGTGHGSDESPASAREVEYHSVSVLGPWFILCRIMWHIWQSIWHRTQSRTILLAPAVCERLVEDTREAAALHGMGDVRLSTGDVLAAFLLKASLIIFITSPPNTVDVNANND